jgi:hypothetical protein
MGMSDGKIIKASIDTKQAVEFLRSLGFRPDKFWWLVVAESVIYACALFYFARELALVSGIVASALLGLFFLVLPIFYNRTFRPKINPTQVNLLLRLVSQKAGLESNALVQVLSETMQWQRYFEYIERRDHYLIPVINPVDVARELIRMRSAMRTGSQILCLYTFHVIPAGRAEYYWWQLAGGKEYFKLQRQLISSNMLQVKRILITVDDAISRNDYFEWLAQSNAGMQVRWAAHSSLGGKTDQYTDFALLRVEEPSTGKSVRSDLIIEERTSNDPRSWVKLTSSDFAKDTKMIEAMFEQFNEIWTRIAPFRIPVENVQTTDSDIVTPGAVAFYYAQQLIRETSEYVCALDISDLKEGIGVVYSDAPYKSWYEATLERIGRVGRFQRIFVLKKRTDSIRVFLEDHLESYFDERGKPLPNCQVTIIFEDDLRSCLKNMSVAKVKEWLDRHPVLCQHLKRVGQLQGDAHANLGSLLMRDFLVTERMIYDYRSMRAKFDFKEELPEFLIVPEGDTAQVMAEWCDIFRYIEEFTNHLTCPDRGTLQKALQEVIGQLAEG